MYVETANVVKLYVPLKAVYSLVNSNNQFSKAQLIWNSILLFQILLGIEGYTLIVNNLFWMYAQGKGRGSADKSSLLTKACAVHYNASPSLIAMFMGPTWGPSWADRTQGAVSIRKTVLPGMAIPMLKIRRPNGRLIFNMEITIRR